MPNPRTFGLVAGLGVGAGIFYYRSLVSAHLAEGVSPHLVMVHADVRKVTALAQARQKRQLAQYLAALLRQLADSGAEVATIPAFTPEICAAELLELTPLPLVSLLEAILAETKRRRLQRVAIVGARVTMETELFGRLQGVAEVVSLSSVEIETLGAIYAEIVQNERATPAQTATLMSVARTLIDRGAEAILLAGTDLSFVLHPEAIDFPHVDGARIHIAEIMRRLTVE